MHLDRAACDRARKSRDARFDGRFFIGVTTTGIYCRPICPARSPKDENVRYFPTAAAAEAAGLRPCLRCRPEASPGTPAWLGTSGLVSRALRLISEGALDRESVEALAARLGITARHLRRLFLQHLGATPFNVAITRRAHFAKKLLDETTLPIADVAAAAGFGSVRRFNSHMRRTYSRTPTDLRRLARHRPSTRAGSGSLRTGPSTRSGDAPECYTFRLSYRPPYDWDAMLSFLAARATPGVEHVDGTGYRRTIAISGKSGTLGVSCAESGTALTLEVRCPDPRALLFIVERVKGLFDLGADPEVIATHLGADPFLRESLGRHPGVRTPGAWDGFELAVRAILGQQISVRGATTLAGRLASTFGTAVPAAGDLDRLFPTPAQLADAAMERVGVMPTRADTIRRLARAVMAGSVSFGACSDGLAAVSALKAIPGIGDWTAEYIALRALGEPDAFPSGDLVLRRVTGCATARDLERRSEAWRPWRSYAVMLLWQMAHAQPTTTAGAVSTSEVRVVEERESELNAG